MRPRWAVDETRRQAASSYCEEMPSTPEAEAMAKIVAEHAPLLRSEGFKKRRHCFNRPVGDGLVHVVKFWMAPKEPSAWTEMPGLRERLYGSFRLDFGVYVPEMTRMSSPRTGWINDYNCHLRRTIGHLLPGPHDDFWWALDNPDASVQAGEALTLFGLPWLGQFPDRQAVLDAFEASGPFPLGLSPSGGLDIADVYRAIGRRADERRTLEEYVAEPMLRSHVSHLSGYLIAQGHDDLVPRIKTK